MHTPNPNPSTHMVNATSLAGRLSSSHPTAGIMAMPASGRSTVNAVTSQLLLRTVWRSVIGVARRPDSSRVMTGVYVSGFLAAPRNTHAAESSLM